MELRPETKMLPSRDQTQEETMATRIAINGFGRVGRAALRAAYERDADLECVAINDLVDAASLAHLLKHDSVYGRFGEEVETGDGIISIGEDEISVLNETDPARLPWAELDVDVVLECTGRFRSRADAAGHLEAGARKVIVSAPMKDPDATVVLGVNFDEVYDPEEHEVVSNASCTTNCLAPVAKVLHETVGIRHGQMTTIHAYTSDQRLVDLPHKDLRRARAAAINLIPTSTGAAKAIGLVIPELAGKLNGFAVRVPIPTGSIVDLTIEASRPTSAEEINGAFAERADVGALEGILAYSEEPLVSSDIVASPFSAVFDAPLTGVVDGTQLKVVAWSDNEWGYSNRLLELATKVLVDQPVLAR
jgi:glyceraldehyde 3-phosphate dehydrogenase